jgi:toxin ParE1/3/4
VRIVWSLTAERNLDAIWEYIAQDNIDAADRMAEKLRVAANNLIDYPRMGRAGRSHGTRELIVSGTPYILIYAASKVRVDIARIVHSKQDWPPKG